MVDKKDITRWSKKYDKDYNWWVQKEQELGAKFRRNKVLSREDLVQVAEWKFKDQENKKIKVVEAVAKNDEAVLKQVSSQVFSVAGEEDAYKGAAWQRTA